MSLPTADPSDPNRRIDLDAVYSGDDRVKDGMENVGSGTWIARGDEDFDRDGVPDFTDGYATGGTGGNAGPNAAANFARLYVMPIGFSSGDTITFTYAGSDPARVDRSGDPETGYVYTPAEGGLRIWTRDGGWGYVDEYEVAHGRDSRGLEDGGDYVTPGYGYTIGDFAAFADDYGLITLYVEGVNGSEEMGDYTVSVVAEHGAYQYVDALRFTVLDAELTAYGTDEAFGEPLAEYFEGRSDPLAIPVNDDIEELFDGIVPDNANDRAAIPPPGIAPIDRDLVMLRLHELKAAWDGGSVSLEISSDVSPFPLRIFDNDGNQLYLDGYEVGPPGYVETVNTYASYFGSMAMARPQGPLADLLHGDVVLWLEAVAPAAEITITLAFRSGSQTVSSDRVALLSVNGGRIRVDSNRDGQYTVADDLRANELRNAAIVLPNCDKDNAGSAPDNWTGGMWNGTFAPPKNLVDSQADVADVATMIIWTFGLDPLPDDLELKLFANPIVPGNDIPIRIFLPNVDDGPNRVVSPNADAIIRPRFTGTAGHPAEPGVSTVTFKKTPTQPNEYSYDILKGEGEVRFAVEGIEMGGLVSIKAVTYRRSRAVRSSEVWVKVAPFVLNDNRRPVQDAEKSVMAVSRADGANAAFITALEAQYGSRLDTPTGIDLWMQDGFELGYAQAPYGEMTIALELPRAKLNFTLPPPPPGTPGELQAYVEGSLLRPGVGVSVRVRDFDPLRPRLQDLGGNIESLPNEKNAGALGYFLHGDRMSDPLVAFFASQGVNPPLLIDTEWLAVAHADEVISLAPDGQHIIVADTELAWALLLWADSISHDAQMLQGMNGLGALGIQVRSVLNNLGLRTYNLFEPQNIAGKLRAVQNAVAGKYQLALPVSPPSKGDGNHGDRRLMRAGALTAFLSAKRYFRVEFTGANTYRVRYTDNPNDPPESWATDPKVGEVKWDRYEVFAEAKAYIFPESWGGSAAQSGDMFTFSADPTAGIVKMPVLFYPSTDPERGGKAEAYTINHVNSLIDPGIPGVQPAVGVTGWA